MAERRETFATLPRPRDPLCGIEGWTWAPEVKLGVRRLRVGRGGRMPIWAARVRKSSMARRQSGSRV